MVRASTQSKRDIEEAYVKASSLPENVHPHCSAHYDSNIHYNFGISSLTLSVDGSKYIISSNERSKFTLKCIDKLPQDVLIEVNSLLFKIIDARRSRGITSQIFHVLKRNESMTFEIGVTDHNNITLENFKNVSLTNAAGYMTITQVQSRKSDDSDESWGIKDNKKLARLYRTIDYDEDSNKDLSLKYAHWKEKLFVEKETEDIKKAKVMLEEALLDKLRKKYVESQKKEKEGKKMYKSPEEIEKEEKDFQAAKQKEWEKEHKKKCVVM